VGNGSWQLLSVIQLSLFPHILCLYFIVMKVKAMLSTFIRVHIIVEATSIWMIGSCLIYISWSQSNVLTSTSEVTSLLPESRAGVDYTDLTHDDVSFERYINRLKHKDTHLWHLLQYAKLNEEMKSHKQQPF
jgi:hypothetical protein